MADEFRLTAGQEFQRVAKALKLQDKTLPRRFKAKLRQVVKPTLVRVKAAVLDLPTEGRQHTGLRKRVARGVKLKINRSASSVRIITTVGDSEEAAIPRGLDTPKGWRHPVFGDKENWTQQPGHDEWFRETIYEDRDTYEDGMMEVLVDAKEIIAASGRRGGL